MKNICSSVSEKVTKNWKWLLLFLFLPGFNACEPSIGLIYPVSLMDVGIDPFKNQGEIGALHWFTFVEVLPFLIIGIIINFIIFLWLVGPLSDFFERRKFTLWVGGIILTYHSAISFLMMWTRNAEKWASYSIESVLEFFVRSLEILSLLFLGLIEKSSVQSGIFLGIDWMVFQILWLTLVFFVSWGIGSLISLIFKK